jgi:drug/metabolite transporter (DMT)-like permease
VTKRNLCYTIEMNPAFAIIAAIGCSLSNGISTVQQKIGADHETNVKRFDFTLMLRLAKNRPYVIGTILELIGYGLSLISLRILPLFLVQSVIAASVVVTALGDRFVLHQRISSQTKLAIGVALVGLFLLSLGAETSRATASTTGIYHLLEVSPVALGLLGILFVYLRGRSSALILAAIAGLSFGNTSTIGRIIVYPHPLWKLIENPLTWSLVGSALLGQYLFTVALQRATATKGNAVMIAMQTLGPAVSGLAFFNDKIRTGFDGIVAIGATLVILGCIATAVDGSPIATI